MTTRERGRVFGEVADAYDGARPGYPDALVAEVRAFAESPRRVVEVGAGTGKATVAFAASGLPIHCLEPDPRMAEVLRARMSEHPQVTVEVARFEEWRPPPGGVDLLYSAQAWHWVDPQTRWQQAYAALAAGGTAAIFQHSYQVVNPDIEDAIWQTLRRLRPDSSTLSPRGGVVPEQTWFAVELAESGQFVDLRAEVFRQVVRYETAQYLALVRTFSAYRMLTPDSRRELVGSLTGIIREHGGSVEVDLATVLALARRL